MLHQRIRRHEWRFNDLWRSYYYYCVVVAVVVVIVAVLVGDRKKLMNKGIKHHLIMLKIIIIKSKQMRKMKLKSKFVFFNSSSFLIILQSFDNLMGLCFNTLSWHFERPFCQCQFQFWWKKIIKPWPNPIKHTLYVIVQR